MSKRAHIAALAAITAGAIAIAVPFAANAATVTPQSLPTMNAINHIVVIYEENHSFDNLYGMWGSVNGQQTNGLTNAIAAKALQIGSDGSPYSCLPQSDVNLTAPPLSTVCSGTLANGKSYNSAFLNAPFNIGGYIPASAANCPTPTQYAANGIVIGNGLPGGCTEDIVHRYYQEQYQINKGAMNRYVNGSDAMGLAMGHYNTTELPIYQYLHSPNAPKYTVEDNFFQAAFGGSFLNHQWLIAAQTPIFTNAVSDGSSKDIHSLVDSNGMPNNYGLYAATGTVKDNPLTQWCTIPATITGAAPTPANTTCGDYAVNTIQPTYQPFAPGTPSYKQLPPLTSSNIGDEMSAKNVSWAWFSGGWDNADGHTTGAGWTNGSTPGVCTDPNTAANAVWPNCPNGSFQYHHQPFNYYANYAPGTAARAAHLQDEVNFIKDAQTGALPQVSFVKPLGLENEHPGYASEPNGSDHLVELLKAIESGPEAKSTMVVVTYDEFGGQWDHVSPPTAAGVSDKWGPGTRIPALVLSPAMAASGVDHTEYDTTSILATIEKRFDLAPLSSRDASVHDLFGALTAGITGAAKSTATAAKLTGAPATTRLGARM